MSTVYNVGTTDKGHAGMLTLRKRCKNRNAPTAHALHPAHRSDADGVLRLRPAMRQHRGDRSARNKFLEMAGVPMALHGRAGLAPRLRHLSYRPSIRPLNAHVGFHEKAKRQECALLILHNFCPHITPMNVVSKPLVLFVACLLSLAALASPRSSTAVFRNNQAKHLIGLKVENEDGISLGKLENFIIDAPSGTVIYALVSSGGGFTGIGAQTKVIPASSFTPATAKRGVTCVNIIQKNWERLPVYKKGDLPKLADYERYRALFASLGLSFSPGRRVPTLTPTGHSNSRSRAIAPSLVLATDLLGGSLIDGRGESLGQINDLLLDTSRDRPAVVLTSTGRMLRKGQTLAIPLSSLQPAGRKKLSANFSLASVPNAPLLTPETWGRKSPADSEIYRFAAR